MLLLNTGSKRARKDNVNTQRARPSRAHREIEALG